MVHRAEEAADARRHERARPLHPDVRIAKLTTLHNRYCLSAVQAQQEVLKRQVAIITPSLASRQVRTRSLITAPSRNGVIVPSIPEGDRDPRFCSRCCNPQPAEPGGQGQRERNTKLRRPTLGRVVMENDLVGVTRCRVARLAPLVFATGLMSGCVSVATHSTVLNVGCSPEPALGSPPMPSPERLVTPIAFTFNNIRLYPPSAASSPTVSAKRAWNAVVKTTDRGHGLQQNAKYSLTLAEWNSNDPTIVSSPMSGQRLLVWLVIGRHIWVSTLTGSNHVRTPRCIYESAMWPVNATSGQLYGQMAFPPSAEVLHAGPTR